MSGIRDPAARAPQAVPGRLRWRCRRGTRELDVLLSRWLDAGYAQASAAQREAFEAMLELPDPLLWDWLSGSANCEDPQFQGLVDEIRGRTGA